MDLSLCIRVREEWILTQAPLKSNHMKDVNALFLLSFSTENQKVRDLILPTANETGFAKHKGFPKPPPRAITRDSLISANIQRYPSWLGTIRCLV